MYGVPVNWPEEFTLLMTASRYCFTEARDGSAETAKGGHYHYDASETREEIEYEGWFNVAISLDLADGQGRPVRKHLIQENSWQVYTLVKQ